MKDKERSASDFFANYKISTKSNTKQYISGMLISLWVFYFDVSHVLVVCCLAVKVMKHVGIIYI